MTKLEICAIEDANPGVVYLYTAGSFYKAYQQIAWPGNYAVLGRRDYQNKSVFFCVRSVTLSLSEDDRRHYGHFCFPSAQVKADGMCL